MLENLLSTSQWRWDLNCKCCTRRCAVKIRVTIDESMTPRCTETTGMWRIRSPCSVTRLILKDNLRQWPTWYTLALFYNSFIMFLYMFRALYSHRQEAELYWCSIWYRHSQSVAVRCTGWEINSLSTCAPDSYWEWGYQMLHQYNSASWWWAYNARNM